MVLLHLKPGISEIKTWYTLRGSGVYGIERNANSQLDRGIMDDRGWASPVSFLPQNNFYFADVLFRKLLMIPTYSWDLIFPLIVVSAEIQ